LRIDRRLERVDHTYLGLDKDTVLDAAGNGAVEPRDVCTGGVEFVRFFGVLLDLRTGHSTACFTCGNALLSERSDKIRHQIGSRTRIIFFQEGCAAADLDEAVLATGTGGLLTLLAAETLIFDLGVAATGDADGLDMLVVVERRWSGGDGPANTERKFSLGLYGAYGPYGPYDLTKGHGYILSSGLNTGT
jgi:hypothetical protein